MTKIEWTDESWNPVTGCTPVSTGCKNCYAAAIAKRFWSTQYPWVLDSPVPDSRYDYDRPRLFSDVQCHLERLNIPIRWHKPRMIFVCSMGDLFHENVPDSFIDQVFSIMGCLEFPNMSIHTFQLLTKRSERMASYAKSRSDRMMCWPPNVWAGTSVENQKTADERIPHLLEVRAAVRFVSLEPLLGPVDLYRHLWEINPNYQPPRFLDHGESYNEPPDRRKTDGLDWCIIGCESGPHRRECKLERVRDIVKQCTRAGVLVFIKQLSINGKVSRNPDEWPEHLRRREMPAGIAAVKGGKQ